MQKTFLEIFPLALAATFSPSGLLFVTMILSGRKSPQRNALLFLLGAVFFLGVIGSFILITFKPAVDTASHPDTVSGMIDIVFGCLIIAVTGRSLIFKKKQKPARKQSHKRPFVIMGFFYMVINVSSLVPFIAANKIISESGLGFWSCLPLFLVLVTITMTMVAFPVLISILLPEKSARVMAPVKSFMARYGSQIAQAYFFLIGIYLIFHGIRRI